ncbi:MAG TPA: GNAT family N-acetyltransferase [Acidimicrobiales bacterium]|nr:GNAT family N-acetyltransferase [Acidimicrobiales bacterium]
MAVTVTSTDDPSRVLERAGSHLSRDPVLHNLITTLLHARVTRPEPGRYWIVEADGTPAGVVLQSPTTFFATCTPMAAAHVTAAVDAIVDAGTELPGVIGEAGTAARFAGHWTERTGQPAEPVQGQRIYALDAPAPGRPTPGTHRRADQSDRGLLVEWLNAFGAETAEGPGGAQEIVERRLADGDLWLWDHDGPAALAGIHAPVAGVCRVGPVYTPRPLRGRGYASALVTAVSAAAVDAGHRCMLYTDLANPVSNSIYRAIGYRAVAEALRYRFSGDTGRSPTVDHSPA